MQIVTFVNKESDIFILLNSDFHELSGILYKFRNDIVLEISTPHNESLKNIYVEVNYDQRYPILLTTPKPDDYTEYWLAYGAAILIAAIIIGLALCALKKARQVRRMTGMIEGKLENLT